MNIKYNVDITKYKRDIIDAFTEYYGEEYRNKITRRFNNIEFYIFHDPNALDNYLDIEKTRTTKKEHEDLKRYYDYIEAYYRMVEHIYNKNINQFVRKNADLLSISDKKKFNGKNYTELDDLDLLVEQRPFEFDMLPFSNDNGDVLLDDSYLVNLGFDKESIYFKDLILSSGLLESLNYPFVPGNPDFNEYLKFRQIEALKKIKDNNITCDKSRIYQLFTSRLQLIHNLMLEYHSLVPSQTLCYKRKNATKYLKTSDIPLTDIEASAFFMVDGISSKKRDGRINYKEARSIYYCPENCRYGGQDHAFIHEIAHAINTTYLKHNNRSEVVCGIVYQANDNSEKDDSYTNLNETINDMIAADITENLHKKGIYIFQKEDVSKPEMPPYYRLFPIIRPYFEENKDNIIKTFMTGNLDLVRPNELEILRSKDEYIANSQSKYDKLSNGINEILKKDKISLEDLKCLRIENINNDDATNDEIKRKVKKYRKEHRNE